MCARMSLETPRIDPWPRFLKSFWMLVRSRVCLSRPMVRGRNSCRGLSLPCLRPRAPMANAALNIAAILWNFVRQHRLGRVLSNDTGVLTATNPDTVRGGDVLYFSYDRLPTLPETEYIRVAPELAVEVRSPSNEDDAVHDKVVEYLNAGVLVVWVADPKERTVTVYRAPDEGKVLHEKAVITAEAVLPEFSCPWPTFFWIVPDGQLSSSRSRLPRPGSWRQGQDHRRGVARRRSSQSVSRLFRRVRAASRVCAGR